MQVAGGYTTRNLKLPRPSGGLLEPIIKCDGSVRLISLPEHPITATPPSGDSSSCSSAVFEPVANQHRDHRRDAACNHDFGHEAHLIRGPGDGLGLRIPGLLNNG